MIASKMSGNLGLLGNRYSGYYPLANERALAKRISELVTQPRFSSTLKKNLAKLKPMVNPQTEARMLGLALANLSVAAAGVRPFRPPAARLSVPSQSR